MTTQEKLKRILALLLEAAKKDPVILSEIERTLGEAPDRQRVRSATSTASRNRRKPAQFDPFTLYEQGEGVLRSKLDELDIEALKDIVSEYGMDSANLVLKWKKPERVRDHIFVTVQSRARKGDAFRS